MAAWGKQLAVLQWARAEGCPWDKKTCSYAAESGHLAVLRWAQAQGCPFHGNDDSDFHDASDSDSWSDSDDRSNSDGWSDSDDLSNSDG